MPNIDLFSDDAFIDPSKDYLTELVGEGKKFSSAAELARGKAEADLHIARIELEQKQLRDELATRIKLEDFLDKVKTSSQSAPQEPPAEPPARDVSGLKPDDIERLLEQKLSQRDAQRTAEQNLNIVVDKLQEVYGPNYAQHLKKQAADLGMSEQAVRQLAASNPKALFKLFGVGEKTGGDTFLAPPRNQTIFTPNVGGTKKGDSYYEEIRKKDPNLYWTPRIQNEIFDRVKEMGAEAFYAS